MHNHSTRVRTPLPEGHGGVFVGGWDEPSDECIEAMTQSEYAQVRGEMDALWPQCLEAQEQCDLWAGRMYALRGRYDYLFTVARLYEDAQWRRSPEGQRKARRKARRKASAEHFTLAEWNAVREFCRNTCLACGRSEPAIELVPDHVVPLSRGGSDAIANIQPLCGECNTRKHTRTVDYRASNGRRAAVDQERSE